jgi:hypothetical protein
LCRVSLIFGVITCLAGFSGVAIGSVAAKKLRPITPRADPLICAFGMITGAPFLLLSLAVSQYNTLLTWVSNVHVIGVGSLTCQSIQFNGLKHYSS